MGSYHFKNERKCKKRRALVTATTVLCIIAVAMAGYLFFNKDKLIGKDSGNLKQTLASQETPSSADTSAANSSAAASTGNEAKNTQSSATADSNSKTVETEDHGTLPKFKTVAKSGKMEDLKELISDYTANLPGKYGVTFIDLATGEMAEVNDKVEYIAASTSKLPVNVFLYENIEEGEVELDDMLTYEKEDMEPGTGIIQSSAFGTKYTVRETSKLAIRKSDNCGVNMLIRLLGIENIRNYLDEQGGQVHYGARHRSCPYDMAMVAKDLYSHYLNNQDLYGELINNMENTDWNDRINGKLPKSVKVAHKIGNQTRTANDVGIVFASHPYVLSIMTDNVDFGTACNSIAGLSEKIYDFEESYAEQTT